MPLYEYRCTRCKHEVEALQKMSDPLLISCPRCDGKLKKLMSSNSFILKGSGWFATDYPNKKKPKPSTGKEK